MWVDLNYRVVRFLPPGIYRLISSILASIACSRHAKMFRPTVARRAVESLNHTAVRPASLFARSSSVKNFCRTLSSTVPRASEEEDKAAKDPLLTATNRAPQGTLGDKEGRHARVDEHLQIEYPADKDMPRSPVVQGRGGMHFKRTLATFSLENKVSVVTGGARGLGLVMAQALVASGSHLAIVDLNSRSIQSTRHLWRWKNDC